MKRRMIELIYTLLIFAIALQNSGYLFGAYIGFMEDVGGIPSVRKEQRQFLIGTSWEAIVVVVAFLVFSTPLLVMLRSFIRCRDPLFKRYTYLFDIFVLWQFCLAFFVGYTFYELVPLLSGYKSPNVASVLLLPMFHSSLRFLSIALNACLNASVIVGILLIILRVLKPLFVVSKD